MTGCVILPAVDVADGAGRPAGAGRGRHRDRLRRPAGGRAGLAARRRRVDPPGRPRRGVRPRRQPRAARRRRRRGSTSRSSCPAASATTTSLAARAGHRRARGSTSAPRRWSRPDWVRSAIARHGDRIAVGLDVRGTTLAARGWTQDGRRPVGDARPARRRRLRPLRRHRRAPGRHPDRPEPRPAPRGLRAHRPRRWWPAAGCPRWTTCARSPRWCLGVEGAIVGKALYAGAFTLPGGAGGGGRMIASQVSRTGAPWEPVVGYSPRGRRRATRVWVSGCTAIVDGEVVHEGDPYAQTRRRIRNVALAALAAARARRSTTSCAPGSTSSTSRRWEEYGRAHGEAFGDVLPADLDGRGLRR